MKIQILLFMLFFVTLLNAQKSRTFSKFEDEHYANTAFSTSDFSTRAYFTASGGVKFAGDIIGISGSVENHTERPFIWDDTNWGGRMFGILGQFYDFSTSGNIGNAAGCVGTIASFESGANDTMQIFNIFNAGINRWGSGTPRIERFAFYGTHLYGGTFPSGARIGARYIFYSDIASPSYFGGNVNSMGYNYAADAEATDAYAITLSGAHTLVAGLEVTFKANTANTDGATLAVNSLTAKALTKVASGSVATALATGDIIAGQIVKAVYDGTQFQIISRLAQ